MFIDLNHATLISNQTWSTNFDVTKKYVCEKNQGKTVDIALILQVASGG